VRYELDVLNAARNAHIPATAEIARLEAELKAVNEALWVIEDDIRQCEADRDFGPKFIELARSVYKQNDRRAMLKKDINTITGSAIVEEKSYTEFN
jgi:predicted anti-sigma-YlaC factor YlaD